MVSNSMENWPVLEAPSAEDIERVKSRATALGGATLNNPHSNRSAVYHPKSHGKLGAGKRVELTNCDEVAQFTAPLDDIELWQEELAAERNPDRERRPTDAQGRADGTRMCAVDDAAHLWPRFQ